MYDYSIERPQILTDKGQREFLKLRDRVQRKLRDAGAVRMGEAITIPGDSWFLMACVDRMVELGELIEVTPPDCRGQDRVFVSGSNE